MSCLLFALLTTCIKACENPSRWAIHTIEGLDSYVADGVVLVGDAVSNLLYVIDRVANAFLSHRLTPWYLTKVQVLAKGSRLVACSLAQLQHD
jgi:hypothetical protein